MSELKSDPAVTVCFKVKIDGKDLGAFTGCDGLGVEVTIEQREEGGNNSFIHQLPGRVKYTNIKLTRPVNTDTRLIAEWFASMTTGVTRTTAEIVAMTGDGNPVITYSLHGVFPVRWTGPSLSVDSPKVATETLELAHHGFQVGPAGGGQN
jgi:phage tail-like protein